MRAHFGALCSIVTCVLLAGCLEGAKPAAAVKLQPVSGTVKVDGKPAEGITVIFTPTGSTQGTSVYGSTDASGKYTLKYTGGEPGCPLGQFIVIFSKLALPDGSPIPEGKTAADVDAVELLPERYRLPEQSEYRPTVSEGGGTFDFELQSR